MPTITRTHVRGGRRALTSSIVADFPPAKQTHKLTPMACVLWLRDFGGYLLRVDLVTCQVRTTADPHEALCMPEDVAEQMGQDIIDATGHRVELRPYRDTSAAPARTSPSFSLRAA